MRGYLFVRVMRCVCVCRPTVVCSLGYVDDVSDVGGELGKERYFDGLSYPATDVSHQLWVLGTNKQIMGKK